MRAAIYNVGTTEPDDAGGLTLDGWGFAMHDHAVYGCPNCGHALPDPAALVAGWTLPDLQQIATLLPTGPTR